MIRKKDIHRVVMILHLDIRKLACKFPVRTPLHRSVRDEADLVGVEEVNPRVCIVAGQDGLGGIVSFEDILGLVDEQHLEFSVRQVHLLLGKLEEVGDRIAVDDRAETEILVEQTR